MGLVGFFIAVVWDFFSCREHIDRQMEFVCFSSVWQFQNWELKNGCSKASVQRGLYPAFATAASLLLYEKLQVNFFRKQITLVLSVLTCQNKDI